jgi:hypothetical protein
MIMMFAGGTLCFASLMVHFSAMLLTKGHQHIRMGATGTRNLRHHHKYYNTQQH